MKNFYTKAIVKIFKPFLLLSIFLITPLLTIQTTSAAGFDLSTLTYSQNFSVVTQENWPAGLTFNNDGTKMFITGIAGDDVNEYVLSTGFDVATASYTQNVSVDNNPSGIAFNGDGTKMFIIGNATNDVNEYVLSPGFDISTASYTQDYSVPASDITGIAFNGDGTRMFISGSSVGAIFQYNLGTGFDLSTASDPGNSSSVASEEALPQGVAFNGDGTKMFVTGIDNNRVSEYDLSTAFDLSDTVTFSQDLDTSTEDSLIYDIAFNSDGTKMFIAGETGDNIYEYITVTVPEFSTYVYILTLLVLMGFGYHKLSNSKNTA